jgi:hypothetical protein
VIRDRAWKRWGKVTRVVAAEKTRERIGNICRNTTIDERTGRVMIFSMLQVDERAAGELFDAFEDCHQPWDTLGLIQGDGSPGVTPLRPGGICGVLHLASPLAKHVANSSLLAPSDLDFVWPTCAVLWRDYRGAPSAKTAVSGGRMPHRDRTYCSSTKTLAPIVRAWSRRVERHARRSFGTSTADAHTN